MASNRIYNTNIPILSHPSTHVLTTHALFLSHISLLLQLIYHLPFTSHCYLFGIICVEMYESNAMSFETFSLCTYYDVTTSFKVDRICSMPRTLWTISSKKSRIMTRPVMNDALWLHDKFSDFGGKEMQLKPSTSLVQTSGGKMLQPTRN